ncbi:MAG: toll/interleukin-1 receptor domain-containing protein [Lewinellaceae bacterium]|nr:toll/interleukin-1 receptor domain-containing protein [Lewinellaceae bacterium]
MEANPVKVFIAYSREDEMHLEMLRKHLSPLERTGHIKVWYDGKIQGGEVWDEAIRKELAQAEAILLLLSASAIASDYFYEQEVKEALERHQRGEARVIPFILRPCEWTITPLGALQAIPKNGKPVLSWDNPDDAYLDGVQHLKEVIKELRGIRADVPGPAPLEPIPPKLKVSPNGDLSAYSCDRDDIITAFRLNFFRYDKQYQRLQVYLMVGQQIDQLDSLVKRLMINLKAEMKTRGKTVKCSPNIKDIVINQLSISDNHKAKDCLDWLRLEVESKIYYTKESPEVKSLQDFAEKIDSDFSAFSPADYIPFAFKIKISGSPEKCWAQAVKPGLRPFIQEFCRLEENISRRFLLFFVIRLDPSPQSEASNQSWLGNIFKRNKEREQPDFNLLEELEAFAEQIPVPATALPKLAKVREADLIEWFLPRAGYNAQRAKEKARGIILELQEESEDHQSDSWPMAKVEDKLMKIVEQEREGI